jgi:acyl carrier protein
VSDENADSAALRATVIDALTGVAPDIEPATLDPARPIRDQFDFDSMDYLNFVTALHQQTGVNVPELDYPQLATVDGCVRYLAERIGRNGGGASA